MLWAEYMHRIGLVKQKPASWRDYTFPNIQDRDGSWLSGDGQDRSGGRNYCTAMAVLALAIEYRYLPIYQR